MLTKMFNVICLLGLLLNTSAIYGQGLKQEVVVTTGQGVSEKDATQDALVQAVAQVRGLAAAREQVGVLRLGELRELVPSDELISGALVVVLVVFVLEVAERKGGAARERPLLLLFVPPCVGRVKPFF